MMTACRGRGRMAHRLVRGAVECQSRFDVPTTEGRCGPDAAACDLVFRVRDRGYRRHDSRLLRWLNQEGGAMRLEKWTTALIAGAASVRLGTGAAMADS